MSQYLKGCDYLKEREREACSTENRIFKNCNWYAFEIFFLKFTGDLIVCVTKYPVKYTCSTIILISQYKRVGRMHHKL